MSSSIDIVACFDELLKLGAVDPQQAQESLERLEAIEKSRPTPAQVARYATLGAVSGPLIGALGDVIYGDKPFAPHKRFAGRPIRGFAGAIGARAVTGALSSGAIPLVRAGLDRYAERDKLRQFMQENAPAPEPEISPPIKTAGRPRKEKDSQFAVSQYSGPLSYGSFPLVSYQGGKAPNSLAAPLSKEGALTSKGLTPAGRLASGRSIGLPKLTAPSGPSIAEVSKPHGFGTKLPGALKGSI